MIQQQLSEISNSLQQCFDPGSQQFQTLAKYTTKIARKREKWPDKILATWRNRVVPVYSPESITKVNQARVSQIEFANEQRKRLQTSYQSDISRCKKKLDDVSKKRDTCEEKYNEHALNSQAQLQLLDPRDVVERVKLSTFLRSAWDSYYYVYFSSTD